MGKLGAKSQGMSLDDDHYWLANSPLARGTASAGTEEWIAEEPFQAMRAISIQKKSAAFTILPPPE
jgi:hypothetical protein